MRIHDEPPPPAGDSEPPTSSNTTVWALGPAITRADIPGLCEQLLVLLRNSDAAVVICDMGAVTDPDAVTIEALARLQLMAQRLGRHIRLHRACGSLQDLLTLTGLRDFLPSHAGLWLEP